MLSYTVYCEAGGVGKTSLTANLAVAHRRAGLDVLVIPLDPQDGDLSRLLGVDDQRDASGADTLLHHLVGRPQGPFEDLVRTVEGVDVIPEHNNLSDLPEYLERERESAEGLGEAYNKHAQLLRLLQENNVADDYDVLICDPQASESEHLTNAIYATRNLVIPVEPSGKGQAAIAGLENLAGNFADQLDIDVGVLAAVPNRVKNTSDQQDILDDIDLPTPVVIGDRTSLMEGCWNQQCSAYQYVREHRQPRRDYEVDTLAKVDELARFIEKESGVEPLMVPEPGDVEVSV